MTMDTNRMVRVAKKMWNDPFLNQSNSTTLYELLMNHRMHSDEPWWTTIPTTSKVYRRLFVHEDYRWMLDPRENGGVNISVFNMILKHKKESMMMDWKLFDNLISTAEKEKTGIITKNEANVIVADYVEAVHPSGIKDILGN